MRHRKCISEEIIDVVDSNVARKYAILAGYKIVIREYGSTLYVGLARAVSPTNTNFG